MSSPVLWGGTNSNALQPGIILGNGSGAGIISGTLNPTVSAVSANPGTIYQNQTGGAIYVKNDSGLTTNWTQISTGGNTPPKITTYTSGSSTHTFTGSPVFVRVKMVGGGGGGSGSGTTGSPASTASNGQDTTFGTSLLLASKGLGGSPSGNGSGSNASSSLGTASGFIVLGGNGGSYQQESTGLNFLAGGTGGNSFLGGGASGSAGGFAGGNASANTGAGGGGAGCSAVSGGQAGAGGGAGDYVEATLSGSVLSGLGGSAAYFVGGGGGGSAAGGSGFAGGNGAAGMIVVEEYYASGGGGGGGSGITRSIQSISSPTTGGTSASTDYVYLVSGATTFTLPTSVGNTNMYTIMRAGASTVTVNTTSSQTITGQGIVGATSVNITSTAGGFSVISNNTNWIIVSTNGLNTAQVGAAFELSL